jgi:hypothetical protein
MPASENEGRGASRLVRVGGKLERSLERRGRIADVSMGSIQESKDLVARLGAVGNRPKARLITYAWGERYVDKLLEFTLPAALAPGNYPYLAELFDVEFVLLTESHLFDHVRSHRTFRRIGEYGPARLVQLDDLLISPGSYGLTLSKALFRGMEDTGPQITDTTFLFLNADFILAQNSYRALVPKLLAGERLVASPSYCTEDELVLPLLLQGHRKQDVIECPHRTMARYILENLHDTVRGQVIDAPFHYDLVYNYQQYDWPEPGTLVGHQMPIAIVAMRPTRQVTSIGTFWDFGAASEFCPGIEPCVLADSDDFLMLELRGRAEGREYKRLGPPSPEKIAQRIGSVLTEDQLRFGRYPVLLHSGDISARVEDSKERLKSFQNRIRMALPHAPVPHLDHPHWRYHEALYRKAVLAAPSRSAPGDAVAESADEKTGAKKRAERYNREFGQFFANRIRVAQSTERDALFTRLADSLTSGEHNGDLVAEISRCRSEIRRLAHQHEMQRSWARAVLKNVRSPHPLPTPLLPAAPLGTFLPEHDVAEVISYAPENGTRPATPRRRGLLRRAHRLLLGDPPNLSHMHPLAFGYRHALKILRERAAAASDILVVSDGPVLPESAITAAGKSFARLGWVQSTEANLRPAPDRSFDLVYCETEVQHVRGLEQFFRNMRGIMASGGRIIVHITNQYGRKIADDDQHFIQSAFGAIGPMRAHYANGRLASLVFRRYIRGLERVRPARPASLLGLAGTLLYCLPLAALVNGKKPSETPEREWVSLTLESWLP